MNPPLPIYVRWMLERDFPAVAAIERVSARRPWSEEDVDAITSSRRAIGMVAQHPSGLCGFAVYEIAHRGLVILKLAVEPAHRRRGVGRRLFGAIARRLVPPRRSRLTFDAAESELSAQLFLHAMGFRAEAILRDYFDLPRCEDAYRMVYRQAADCAPSDERRPPRPAPRPAAALPKIRASCGAKFALGGSDIEPPR